ncbi:MAG: outer membrane protein assembly factor BamC [Ramlibacter sp.]|nr:outer membrane protein assembly factor BamC [Ramlibacter sp.]
MQFAKFGVVAICAALSLSACSVLEGDKIDYKSASKGAGLEVPPDLNQLSRDSRYTIPGGAVTASSFQVGQAAPGVPTAATTLGDVRVERSGNQRWLVVNRPADQVWGPVRDFWQENGFLLAMDQANLGIMETDWAENRAKIPQDFIRNTLGKLLDSVYSTSERDRFRTRLERSASGGTEIYISHRGMIEVYNNNQKDQTVWQPRPTDPELEAEFLRRLMVKLGVPQEQSKALVASGAAKTTSRVATVGSTPVVQIDEGFDRAWRRVGLALDRTGFTVEDRDRGQGTYFVRYVEPTADRKERGFLGKLFGPSEKAVPPLKFRINLQSQGESTTVSVLNAGGAPESSANAQRIVQVIADDLR